MALGFAKIAISFILGILFAPLFSVSWPVILGIIIVLFGVVLTIKKKKSRFMLLVITAFLFGVFIYTQSLPPADMPSVADHTDKSVRVSGVINGEVEERINYQRAVISQVKIADIPVYGRVQVRLLKYPELNYGDRLTFSCRLEKPEPIESFRYDKYLESKGILALCNRPQFLDIGSVGHAGPVSQLLAFKKFLVSRLHLIFPEPHASFLSGLLFGGSSSLSKSLKDDFSRTGTSHILAASGFNLSLFSVVFLTWILSTPLGRRRALILTAVLLAVYVILAGATPAVVRAAIMAGILLLGKWVARKPFSLNLFLAALAVMLLFNPKLLLNDVGFQLSFIATFAVMEVAPRFKKKFAFVPERYGIQESFVASLSAVALTTPIILWHFSSISIISPLVNLLILPIIPFVMGATLIALATSFVSIGLATYVGIPAWAISNLMLQIITWYSSLDYAQWDNFEIFGL